MTGRLLDETLGRWQFWLFFIGFNVTFFPMHLLGLEGMPRRMWTYPAGMGWSGMNLIATIGAWTIGLSVLLFIVNVWRSWRHGQVSTADPWGGGTLEWSTAAPPPPHNFDVLPIVRGRDPLWESVGGDARIACVSGLAADAREVLLTTALDARPDLRMLFPSPSPWPLISALATTLLFIGSIFTPNAVIWGSVPVAIALIAWFWPRRSHNETGLSLELPPWDARAVEGGEVRRSASSRATLDVRKLPTFAFGVRSPMWWATFGLMLIEGTAFAIAIAMYFYLRSVNATWPLNAPPPDLRWGTLNTLVLLVSLLPNEAARRAAHRGDRVRSRLWLSVCLAFALVFLVVRGLEFASLNVSWYTNAYGSIVWLLMGLHTTHLITDTIDTTVLAVLLFTGPFEGRRFVDISENAVYWYFVVLSWLPIYAVVYLAPRLQL
jgi:cytochrome c oxidase subunit 1/cytochrome c oxidase subunit I+III